MAPSLDTDASASASASISLLVDLPWPPLFLLPPPFPSRLLGGSFGLPMGPRIGLRKLSGFLLSDAELLFLDAAEYVPGIGFSPAMTSSVSNFVSGIRKEISVPQSMKHAKISIRCASQGEQSLPLQSGGASFVRRNCAMTWASMAPILPLAALS